jgi:hypothetical protein
MPEDNIVSKGEMYATHKVCVDCGNYKRAGEFSRYSRSKDGLYSYCKDCRKERRRKYDATPEAKRKARERAVLRRYGLNPYEYRKLLSRSDGRCEICREALPEDTKFIHVDHDHVSGAIRGILCRGCNSGIGHFRENSAYLYAAIDYLRKHRILHE